MVKLSFWYEFASTYSYLSATRIKREARKRNIHIIWRPFLLGPIFQNMGWETSPFKIYTKKGEYMWRDMERLCDKLGLAPLTRPDPFPQHSLLASRIAIVGQTENWLPNYTQEIFSKQFAEGRNISDEQLLIDILNEMNLNGSEILETAKNDPETKNILRLATEEAQETGIFGAPSFTTDDGELFWGNDRLEDALDWAAKLKGKNQL